MIAPIVHGGGITQAARLHGGRPEDWLDLSTGINPCPPPLPRIDPRAWHRLPDLALLDAARDVAAAFYRTGAVRPLPVPGTQSAIQLLPRLAPPGRPVAILSPTYGEYARAFTTAGFQVEAIAGLEDIRPDHGLVVVVNPDNPTGRVYPADDLGALAGRLSGQGSVLVVDEAFADCDPGGSVAPLVASLDDLIVFRSFGKFFGYAGLRLGFVVAQAAVLQRIDAWLGPWAVSGPALSVAWGLMSGRTDGIRDMIIARKAGLDRTLSAAGLTVIGGTPLFSLVRHDDAAHVHAALCRHRILARRFEYDPHWLRFGLAADTDGDARLALALSELVS